LLVPNETRLPYDLWQGLNVLKSHIEVNGQGWVCQECARSLRGGKLPKYALNNNMWLGDPPLALRKLTFAENLLIAQHHACCYVFKLYPKDVLHGHHPAQLQRAMAGNVTLYEVNTTQVASMLEGALLPQGVVTLSSILAITFIGTRRLPSDWLSRTFRVRRQAVHDALLWLHEHNELYGDIQISGDRLALLPDDSIPEEIEAVIRYEKDETAAIKEREGYAMEIPEVWSDGEMNSKQRITVN